MGQSGREGPPDGAAPSGPALPAAAADGGAGTPTHAWTTYQRDEEIEGWKINLSGHVGAFFVKDSQLHTMGKTIDEYIDWLRQAKPHR